VHRATLFSQRPFPWRPLLELQVYLSAYLVNVTAPRAERVHTENCSVLYSTPSETKIEILLFCTWCDVCVCALLTVIRTGLLFETDMQVFQSFNISILPPLLLLLLPLPLPLPLRLLLPLPCLQTPTLWAWDGLLPSLAFCRGPENIHVNVATAVKSKSLFINVTTEMYLHPFDAHCCHAVTAIKHPVPDRVKPLFVIFDIRTLWCSALRVRVSRYQKLLSSLWYRMLYSCTHMEETVDVKGI